MPQQPTALIVEDEADMAAEIADLLRAFGHACLHAATFVEAQKRLAEGGFSYILLDLEIKWDSQSIKPRLEFGMSLLRDIRKRYPRRNDNDMHQVPVIVVSGHGKDPKNIIGVFKGGVDDFLMKPLGVDGQDIRSKIDRCLELAGQRHCADRGAGVDRINETCCESAFWHAADYSAIALNGRTYRFTGDIQRKAVAFLHAAARTEKPWRAGKLILQAAESADNTMRMVNLFGRHEAWNVVILSDGRGKYRLKTA